MRDVGSLNGTYVNRERIDEVPLSSGDEVQIGKFKLVYLRGTAVVTEPPGEGAPEHGYLSIGDVLTLLREEFPDVTISKIRFLESQGLVNPERTPSGYRKFYEHDVERLRWVLRQQREHFLPLKVIRDRLEQVGGTANGPVVPSLFDGDFADPPEIIGELVGAVAVAKSVSGASASTERPGSGGYDELFQPPGDDDVPTRPLDDELDEGSAGAPDEQQVDPAPAGDADPAPATRRRASRATRPTGGSSPKDAAPKTPARRTGDARRVAPRSGTSGPGDGLQRRRTGPRGRCRGPGRHRTRRVRADRGC